MARRDALQAPLGYRRTLISYLRRVLGLFLLGVLIGSDLAHGADDPAIDAGLSWIVAQVRTDGSIRGPADIATTPQATAEALITLAGLAPTASLDPAASLGYLEQAETSSTEALARHLLASVAADAPPDADLPALLALQGDDGGFGADAGHASTVLDTALALEALAAAGRGTSPAAGAAIGYLAAAQLSSGAWPGVDGRPARYETALAQHALWSVRDHYSVTATLDQAQSWLLGQVITGDRGEPFETALCVLALLPRLVDATSLSAALDALRAGQASAGSWNGDLYTTALVLRALGLAAQPVTNPDLASLAGRVLDGDTGLPLAGVEVTLDGAGIPIRETDAAGRFAFDALASGDYGLGVGYADYSSLSAIIHLATGTALQLGDLTLTKVETPSTATLRGRVTDAANDAPLPGVEILTDRGLTATTAQDGSFQLAGLAPGALQLSASLAGYLPASGQTELTAGGVFVFSPALVADGPSPPPPPTGPATLRGLVLDSASGEPLTGVDITVVSDGGATSISTTDESGRFVLDELFADGIDLGFSLDGYRHSQLWVSVTPGTDLDLGQVRLRPLTAERLLPDPVVVSVDATARHTDPQTLSVTGVLGLTIENRGTSALAAGLPLVAFYDTNASGDLEPEADAVLGRTTLDATLDVAARTTLDLPISGELAFRDAPILVRIDPDGAVIERDESNNLASSVSACRLEPAPLAGVTPVEKWRWSGVAGDPTLDRFVHVVNTVLVGQLSDDDGDGEITERDIPDLVFAAGGDAYRATKSVLVALSGDDGHELWHRADLAASQRGAGALGDIDGDGLLEIVTADLHRKRLIALENEGTVKWSVEAGPARSGTNIADGLVIADLDGDGASEIVQGARVYESDGSLLWSGDHNEGSWGFVPIVADVDLDGSAEVIHGRTLYDAWGDIRWFKDRFPIGGYNAVGNFDNDPEAEIVLVSGGGVRLLEHDGEPIWGPVAISGGGGGPPTVGDFDNDGEPEIGVAGSRRYAVFDGDGSLMWDRRIADTSSGATGSSLFDFDDDGKAEVLYADERYFRIYDGASGDVLVEIPNDSATATEYPVVADVDGDGAAEIVVSANNTTSGFTGIRVFEPPEGQWAATRGLWSQHSDHITNIDEDGGIPAHEAPSWLVHNTYRLNRFLARDALAEADLTLSRLMLTDNGTGAPMTLSVRLGNGGGQAPTGPIQVALYRGNPSEGGSLLGRIEVSDLPAPGWRDLQLDGVPMGSGDLYAVVDPEGVVEECDEANNALSIPGDAAASLGDLTVATDAASYGPDSAVAITLQVANPGSFASAYRIGIAIEDAGGSAMATPSLPALDPVPPGATATLTAAWDTATTLAGDYRVAARLYDDTERLLSEAGAPFAIVPASGPLAELDSRTDRLVYEPGDNVEVSVHLTNPTANQPILAPRLRFEEYDADGTLVQTIERTLSDLLPGAERTITETIGPAALPEGEDRLEVRLDSTDGTVLAQTSDGFAVAEDPARVLSATLTLAAETLERGASQVCTATLGNAGSKPLDAVGVRRLLANLAAAGEVPLASWQDIIDLAPGAERTWTETLPTDALTAGDHACILQVRLSGDWQTLAQGIFRLTEPPVPLIEASLGLAARGRLLVLLDPPAHCTDTCPDPDPDPDPDPEAERLAQLLEGAGWRWTLTRDADAFVHEQRSGGYATYLLSSATIHLPEGFQDALVEAVYAGGGLVVVSENDQRNDRLDEALGIRAAGRLADIPGLLPDATLAAGEPIAFTAATSVQRIDSLTATPLAVYLERDGWPGDEPAVVWQDYGAGRSLYLGFDALAEAAAAPGTGTIPGPFGALLLAALEATAPPTLPPAPGAVVPLAVTLSASMPAVGTPPGVQVELLLPPEVGIVDLGEAIVIAPDILSWDLVLPGSDPVTLTAWLRLPDAELALPFTSLVWSGAGEPQAVDLTLTPERPPGLEAARVAMAGRKVYRQVLKDLDKAADRLAVGEPQPALDALLKAARTLRGIDAPDAPLLRGQVDQAIAETARTIVLTRSVQ